MSTVDTDLGHTTQFRSMSKITVSQQPRRARSELSIVQNGLAARGLEDYVVGAQNVTRVLPAFGARQDSSRPLEMLPLPVLLARMQKPDALVPRQEKRTIE